MKILEVDNIYKQFGDYFAVNGVSFAVDEGLICGVLGPNGAGKTTTIRMITNILQPDKGRISVFGKPMDSEAQNHFGYLPEERGLYKRIKVIDQLIYFGRLKGLSASDAAKEARLWLKKLDASDWENKKIQELSKGMQQKVQFISAILHKPKLLVLDEPFSGFDPINADLFKKIVIDLKNEGTTILLSTHIMEQAEQMCDKICLIHKGQAVLSGNLRDVKKNFGRDSILIEFEGDSKFLDKFSGLKFTNRSSSRAEFRIGDSGINPKDILMAAIESVEVFKFELAEPSLHEIFIDVVSKQGGINDGK
jgi:ABC-2 type transport system ATP-binding protein